MSINVWVESFPKPQKQFAIELSNLDSDEDSNDLDLKIKSFFSGRTFVSQIVGKKEQFFISPYIESHLKLKLYFPAKQYWSCSDELQSCESLKFYISFYYFRTICSQIQTKRLERLHYFSTISMIVFQRPFLEIGIPIENLIKEIVGDDFLYYEPIYTTEWIFSKFISFPVFKNWKVRSKLSWNVFKSFTFVDSGKHPEEFCS